MTLFSRPPRSEPLNSIREVPGPVVNSLHPATPPPPPSSSNDTEPRSSTSHATSPVSPTLPIQKPSDDDLTSTSRQDSLRRLSDPGRNKPLAKAVPARKAHSNEAASTKTSIKKKHGSMFSFFSLKDPSTAAFNDYAAAQKKQAADHGSTANGAAKLPSTVPRVNTKWDGLPRPSKDKTRSSYDRRDSGWSSSRRWSSNPSSRGSMSAAKPQINFDGGSPFASSNVLPDEDRRTEFPFDKKQSGSTNTPGSSSARPSSNLATSTVNPSQPVPLRPVSPINDQEATLPQIPKVASLTEEILSPPSPGKSVSPAQSFISARAVAKQSAQDSDSTDATTQPHMPQPDHLLRQESSVSSLSPVVSSQKHSPQPAPQDKPSPERELDPSPQPPKRPPRPFDEDEELYAKPGHSPMRQDFALLQPPSSIAAPSLDSSPSSRSAEDLVRDPQKQDLPAHIEDPVRDVRRDSKRLPSDHNDAKWVSGLDEVAVSSSGFDSRPLGRRASLNQSPTHPPSFRLSQATPLILPVQVPSSAHSHSSSQNSPAVHVSPAPEQYRRSLHSEQYRAHSHSRSRSATPPRISTQGNLQAPDQHPQASSHSRQISSNSMSSYMDSSQMSDSPHQVAQASMMPIQSASASPVDVQPVDRFEPAPVQNRPLPPAEVQAVRQVDPMHDQQQSSVPVESAIQDDIGPASIRQQQQQQPSLAHIPTLQSTRDDPRMRHARNFSKPFNLNANKHQSRLPVAYAIDDALVPRSKFARGPLAPKAPASPPIENGFGGPEATTKLAPPGVFQPGSSQQQRLPSVKITPVANTSTVFTTPNSIPDDPPSAATTNESYATAIQSATPPHNIEDESPSTRNTSLDVPPPDQHRLQYRLSARDITIVNDPLMSNKVTETSEKYALSVGFWETANRSTEEALHRQETGMDCRLAGPFDPSSPVF
ncbi:hypothetical protein B9Z65_5163 [Elsinoe australis]|uniref:Uncharacterized protein n=1 Tax=Elsinoe australis TaxID=40998 RepID=A0A2P7ZD93_9PEZI|nr:hypothetical protein B9Z65_5163 [Elsinoe australis]